MTDPSPTYDLLRTATTSAVHLETRESYLPGDPDWRAWQAGERFDPVERWPDWFNLVKATTDRGVAVRRARIVSEPVTDYIAFEYDITSGYNVAAGEQVRWLARKAAVGLLVPAVDFWVFDGHTVVLNHFDGPGNWVAEELREDQALAQLHQAAFDAVWERATPHDEYRPPRAA